MKIHLIHGIRSVGQVSVDELVPYLTGFEIAYPDYGYILELETKIVNSIIVGAILPYVATDDVLVGHSNGCAVAFEVMSRLNKVGGAVFINAALRQDVVRPPSCPWIDVYFNAGDQITELAAVGARLGIVDGLWGEMGHAGYDGPDPQITNIDCCDERNMPMVWGHSAIFEKKNISAWGPYIAERIRKRLGI